MKLGKRLASALMAALLLVSLLPMQALAVEPDCPHHPEHTPECGYAPATVGSACTHEHTDACYDITTACILEGQSTPPMQLKAPSLMCAARNPAASPRP